MGIPSELISQLVKINNKAAKKKIESTVYGETVERDGSIYVRFDGSELLTPVSNTANVGPGERVMVLIKNHTATITGNLTSPAARYITNKTTGKKYVENIDQDKVDMAAKIATNFISYEADTGLQLGNKSDGSWVGFRIQILPDSFNVLDADGVVQASYGKNLIELGKNNPEAIIDLCGHKGMIEYDSAENYLEVTGDKLRLKGDSMASLYSPFYDGNHTARKSAVNVSSDSIYIYSQESIDLDPDTQSGHWTTSEFKMDSGNINMLADYIHESSRYGSTYETVSGDIVMDPNGRTVMRSNMLIGPNDKDGYNDGVPGWYMGIDGTAHATHKTGGSLIAFHYAGSTNTTSTIKESSSGIISINKMYFGVNKILWSGEYWMQANQTAVLSEKIGEQTNGIVLVFSRYANGTTHNHHWSTHFVPKALVTEYDGGGQTFHMGSDGTFGVYAAKYLYIRNDSIQGHDNNKATGTGACGIKYTNNEYVLRYVIGV